MSNQLQSPIWQLTIPVMMGYLPLGAVYGVLWINAGLTWYWAPLMSLLLYAGAMQYLAIGLLIQQAGWLDLAIATLLVNFRHMFYGLSLFHLLPPRGLRRLYFMFGITDETYSLLTAAQLSPPVPATAQPANTHPATMQPGGSRQALQIVALNQSYWILGTLAGVVLASGLPSSVHGLDFALTALFTVLAVEQIRLRKDWGALALGLGAAVVCAWWLPHYFLLAASLILVLVLWAAPARTPRKEPAHD